MDKKDLFYLFIILMLSSVLLFQNIPHQDLPQEDFIETLPKMGQ
jgi:hypothetical protein